ncbi:MAG: hypothetical protein SWH61_15190 [Thermodesulfobacteriota bacterium]|nr:hypothetical protein [Thermodesulfobacteriota bacterium]
MFWKKKLINRDPPGVLFAYETTDRRSAYRVQPSPEAPVIVDFEGNVVEVNDISAVGVSLKSSLLKKHGTYEALLGLPGRGVMIECVISVVDIDTAGIAHCSIRKMDDDGVELIHRYVLERQKQLLREEKERRQQGLE